MTIELLPPRPGAFQDPERMGYDPGTTFDPDAADQIGTEEYWKGFDTFFDGEEAALIAPVDETDATPGRLGATTEGGETPLGVSSGIRLTVPIDRIDRPPSAYHRPIEEKDYEAFCASIAAHGILNDLIVRCDDDNPSRYLLVCGRLRLDAAARAGHRDVPIRVVTATDAEADVLSFTDNAHRSDFGLKEKAMGLKGLQDRHGFSLRELVKFTGIPCSTIQSYLAVLGYHPSLQAWVFAEPDRLSLGKKMSALSPLEAQAALETIRMPMTTAEARPVINKLFAERARRSSQSLAPAERQAPPPRHASPDAHPENLGGGPDDAAGTPAEPPGEEGREQREPCPFEAAGALKEDCKSWLAFAEALAAAERKLARAEKSGLQVGADTLSACKARLASMQGRIERQAVRGS